MCNKRAGKACQQAAARQATTQMQTLGACVGSLAAVVGSPNANQRLLRLLAGTASRARHSGGAPRQPLWHPIRPGVCAASPPGRRSSQGQRLISLTACRGCASGWRSCSSCCCCAPCCGCGCCCRCCCCARGGARGTASGRGAAPVTASGGGVGCGREGGGQGTGVLASQLATSCRSTQSKASATGRLHNAVHCLAASGYPEPATAQGACHVPTRQ